MMNNKKIKLSRRRRSKDLQQRDKEVLKLNQELVNNVKEFDTLKEKYNNNLVKYNLLAKLISTSNNIAEVASYFSILESRLLPFLKEINIPLDKTTIISELQDLGNKLKIASACPELYYKKIIAIAGGFSAGKSRFINSLFLINRKDEKESLKLPVDINPMTAIPTYILNSEDKFFKAVNNDGALINLLDISTKPQDFITHKFLESFGFNFKKIMPFIFLGTPLSYQNLCFVDTPGYNPGDEVITQKDRQTAKEFVDSSDILIWVIGADANGTIIRDDIEFLKAILDNNEKPLYIILNKADLKDEETLADIIDEIDETLEDEYIPFVGISAYSSNQSKEFCYRRKSLIDFLAENDIKSNRYQLLLHQLMNVHNKCRDAIEKQINKNKDIRGEINVLELFINELSGDKKRVEKQLDKLHNYFPSSTGLNKNLDEIDKIFSEIGSVITSILKI